MSKRIAGSFNTETAASGTAGRQYNVNISNYTPQVGDKITIIPHITSTSEGATLCINNGVGYQFRRTNSAYGNYFDSLPYASSFLRTALPVSLIFTGSSWGIDVTKPHGEDILGIVRVKSGGTGRNEIPANSAMFGDGTNPLKLVTPNPETDDGKTLVFSKTEGWKLANASSAKAMGEVYASLSNLDSDNPGAVLLSVDSATSGKYLTPTSSGYSADFYNWLKTKHAERITTKTNYDTAIANFGRCELYVLDEEPGSIRYPLKPAKKIRALIDKKTETIQTSDPAAPATLKWELYSDGWCKQLFNITNIGDRQITVPFKFAMQDNDYFALRIGGAYGNNNANVRTTFNVKNGDLTSIDIWNYGGYNAANALYIEGYSSDPLPEEYNNSNELLYYWVSVANAQIEKSVQFVNQEGPLRDIEDLKDATGFSTTGFNNLKNMDAPDYAAAEVIFDNTALLVTTELSWTATKDGYISFNAYGFNGAEAYLRVNGTEIAQGSTTSSSHISACAVALAKVSAGDIVTCKNAYATSAAYLRRFLKFIPYKG